MNFTIGQILHLVGSLALFLFGMKLMSEALQKLAGAKLQSILSAMTSNRFKGIVTGFIVTIGLQSSSATTVILVSFVNAGLITLAGAIAVIMGANIGTTLTGWLISFFGFKVSIAKIAIPIIGIAFPLLFSKVLKRRGLGEFLIGFALLFIGLGELRDSVPDFNIDNDFLRILHVSDVTEIAHEELLEELYILRNNDEVVRERLHRLYPGEDFDSEDFKQAYRNVTKHINENPDVLYSKFQLLRFISRFQGGGLGSILIFIVIGTLLTIIIQSSSATMALTIVMGYNGIIPFELAAAMILGENIGTTITANIAATVGNTMAKRAARAHLIFNLIGVVWILIIYTWFLGIVDWFVINIFDIGSPFVNNEAIPFGLSFFHSIFNIANMLLLVSFVPYIEKIVRFAVPQKESEDEIFRLKYIDTGMVSTSELSVVQARKEISIYGKRAQKMFRMLSDYLDEKDPKIQADIYRKIAKYEDITDKMEVEIAKYLINLSQGELSYQVSKEIRAMLKIIDDLESIGDVCLQQAMAIDRGNQNNIKFTERKIKNLKNMYALIDEAFDIMNSNLDIPYYRTDLKAAVAKEKEINDYRNKLRDEHVHDVEQEKYTYAAGVLYSDLFNLCEKTGDYIINISEALVEE